MLIPSTNLLTSLFLPCLPLTIALPLSQSFHLRAEDNEEDDGEGWIDSMKTTSDDWCADNPELCSTSVVVPVLLIMCCIFFYFCYYKPRKSRKFLQELERQKQNNNAEEAERKRKEQDEAVANKTKVSLMKKIFGGDK
uniref:Uncharacterized protein n=1 Tax=Kwoniella dejecticola CBS 10117 TaxID=1296121 RepID=A0A1A6A4T1_9TREE|nr:uncharacterized protein I303_04396 [Kwoniella dejecticola CBS 10117]OBR85066.1 hypothetical protein I303_04396 [Kwoniella dejecticola CBS 10117]